MSRDDRPPAVAEVRNEPGAALAATAPPADPEPRHFRARGNWQSAEKAAVYRRARHPTQFSRFFREEAIVSPWLDDLGKEASVLDIPCGTGRWIPTLTGRGFRYTGADVSQAMTREARTATAPPAVQGFVVADLAYLPFPDDSFDAVIIWRLLHHVPDSETRRALLREAARVSRCKVIVSFHHPLSFAYPWKVIRRQFFGFKQGGRGITHWQLKREAEWSGLEIIQTRSFWKYASINWFACLGKRGSDPRARSTD